MSRFNDNLLEPIQRREFVPSEQERFNAAFGYVQDYAKMLGLAIKMVHLHENRNENAIEASIKNVLQKALQITTPNNNANQDQTEWIFGNYLLQYVIFEAM